MMGYGDDEMNTTVLELTYNYGVTEYTKGDGYGQVHTNEDSSEEFPLTDLLSSYTLMLCASRLPWAQMTFTRRQKL